MTYSLRTAALVTGCVFMVIGLTNYNKHTSSIVQRQLQAQGGWGQQGGPQGGQGGGAGFGQQQGGGGWQQNQQGGGGWGQQQQQGGGGMQQPPPQQVGWGQQQAGQKPAVAHQPMQQQSGGNNGGKHANKNNQGQNQVGNGQQPMQQIQGSTSEQQSVGFGVAPTECEVLKPREEKVIPTWSASFPGSGIKIFWQVAQGMTGLFTSDDNDSTGTMKRGVAVTVKTHFPSPHVSAKFYLLDTTALKSAILLLRNPVEALPSYFKFLYRFELGHGPSAEIPIGEWVAWRNENLELQMTKWIEHTKYWLETYGATNNLLIVQFEKLTSKREGAETLARIGNFLGNIDPTVAAGRVPDASMPCLWNKLIGETIPEEKLPKNLPTASEAPRYPYTVDQLDMLANKLKGLKRDFAKDPNADLFINDYIKGITSVKRQIEKLLAS